jgi:hypothetical protein
MNGWSTSDQLPGNGSPTETESPPVAFGGDLRRQHGLPGPQRHPVPVQQPRPAHSHYPAAGRLNRRPGRPPYGAVGGRLAARRPHSAVRAEVAVEAKCRLQVPGRALEVVAVTCVAVTVTAGLAVATAGVALGHQVSSARTRHSTSQPMPPARHRTGAKIPETACCHAP